MGFSTFLDFVHEESMGKYTLDYCKKLKADYLTTLFQIASEQIEYTDTEDPAKRFIKLIQTALSSGHAHVADSSDGYKPTPYVEDTNSIALWGWQCTKRTANDDQEKEEWRPRGDCIGWLGEKWDKRTLSICGCFVCNRSKVSKR
jgi:hypothetical protein